MKYQPNKFSIQKIPIIPASVCLVGLLFLVFFAGSELREAQKLFRSLRHNNIKISSNKSASTLRYSELNELKITPWASIGGCGAGGSGGSGSSIKWVGKGVSGGLIDLEHLYSKNLGQDFILETWKTRFSWKPSWNSQLGLTLPVVAKMGPLQPQTNVEVEAGHISGGISDITLDYSRTFGIEGEFNLSYALTLPTGQYDIKRGKDKQKQYVSTNMQRGGGLYNSSITLGITKDVEDGLWMADIGYSHPFNLNFSGKNRFLTGDIEQYKDINDSSHLYKDDPRFFYTYKGYGENDLGGFTPPSISTSFTYGYRGHKNHVHSFGFSYSHQLGVGWIPEFTSSWYNPKPDPDFQVWSGSITYGLEFSRDEMPIFLAVSKTIHDKTNPPGTTDDRFDPNVVNKWSGPDWNDFVQNWTFGIGIKAAMF